MVPKLECWRLMHIQVLSVTLPQKSSTMVSPKFVPSALASTPIEQRRPSIDSSLDGKSPEAVVPKAQKAARQEPEASLATKEIILKTQTQPKRACCVVQ